MRKIIGLLLLIVSCQLSGAEVSTIEIGRVGNGGNVIICLNPATGRCYGSPYKHTVVFYDTFESDKRYGWKPLSMYDDFVSVHSDVQYAIHLLNTSLQQHDPELLEELTEYVHSFYREANLLADIVLLPITDTGISFIPPSSELRQLVVQRKQIAPEDKRYVISKDLWVLLSPADQSHAILHEILYRYALSRNQQISSSEYVRYFNALIISGVMPQLKTEEYFRIKAQMLQL